ncbi:MAG TPA: FAD-dependent oxidoreductase [Clostridiaceae bacterium]|nr:FAD-dependent oxidoreductase [Clostridiaceae bacterium]
MLKKILIVGGVAGGMSAAARIRRLDEKVEIIVFERGEHVSFSNCCLPYHLSGTVATSEELVLTTPQALKANYNIDARVRHEVIDIDRANSEVEVRDLNTGKIYREAYDKLLLSPGAVVPLPPIKGLDDIRFFTVRNVQDVEMIQQHLSDTNAADIIVVGGGFIGVETAENLKMAGYEVNLVEMLPQVLMTFDFDMVQILQKELVDQGVKLYLNEAVSAFEDGQAVLKSGKKMPADVVIMATGSKPDSALAAKSGLELTDRKAIKVDQNFLTSDPDIYAIGDAVEVFYSLSRQTAPLPLAGPAIKQARFVADHMYGRYTMNTGYIGSSCLKVFNYNAAVTGLTENTIKGHNLPVAYDYVYVIPKDMVGIMPEAKNQYLKVIFEMPTGKILGAQCIGRGDVVKRCDVIAAMLKFGPTLEDLKDLELCYAPPFSIARDSVNFAGYVGLNILHGDIKQIHVADIRGLVESGAYFIDSRTKEEFDSGHIKGAVNIPLQELRQRMDEVPKDRAVYLYCRSSTRSYNAVCALQNSGWNNVFLVSGSMLGVSWCEWFEDQRTGREPIVTKYNFN